MGKLLGTEQEGNVRIDLFENIHKGLKTTTAALYKYPFHKVKQYYSKKELKWLKKLLSRIKT